MMHNSRDRKRRREIAYHEAGHAVVAWILGIEITEIDMTASDNYRANAQTRSADG
jgi:ATP-dependent Zn protease